MHTNDIAMFFLQTGNAQNGNIQSTGLQGQFIQPLPVSLEINDGASTWVNLYDEAQKYIENLNSTSNVTSWGLTKNYTYWTEGHNRSGEHPIMGTVVSLDLRQYDLRAAKIRGVKKTCNFTAEIRFNGSFAYQYLNETGGCLAYATVAVGNVTDPSKGLVSDGEALKYTVTGTYEQYICRKRRRRRKMRSKLEVLVQLHPLAFDHALRGNCGATIRSCRRQDANGVGREPPFVGHHCNGR
ncbi:hypothetical protein V5799_018322 [Amblyomma americanum]|uniref:Uncharacterized protein n=1 Tax=Amblyomma americanum TaxID=6943 RepID=A0AAQ4F0T2_AMBAM